MTARTDRCAVTVDRGDSWHSRPGPCGRPVKGTLADGTAVCGVHLRAATQKAAKADTRRAWQARIAAVNDALGIRCSSWDPDSPVLCRIEDLEALADRIESGHHRQDVEAP